MQQFKTLQKIFLNIIDTVITLKSLYFGFSSHLKLIGTLKNLKYSGFFLLHRYKIIKKKKKKREEKGTKHYHELLQKVFIYENKHIMWSNNKFVSITILHLDKCAMPRKKMFKIAFLLYFKMASWKTWISFSINYFSIAMKKYHDSDNKWQEWPQIIKVAGEAS